MFDWIFRRNELDDDPTAFIGTDGILMTAGDGFLNETHVISNLGWRSVDALCIGDRVLTFDNGMRPIIEIQRETLQFGSVALPKHLWPVLVPKGALLNRREIMVAPDQGVFLESDLVSDTRGDPFAVVPARSLVGFRDIDQERPSQDMVLTTLGFAQDEVVYAEGGMLAYCPKARQILSDDADDLTQAYNVLSQPEAVELIARLQGHEDETQIGWRTEEIMTLRTDRPGRPA